MYPIWMYYQFGYIGSMSNRENKRDKPWDGAQTLDVKLRIPCDVVMLCKLTNVSPEDLLSVFLSCLAVENDKKNSEAAKEASINFFIRSGYGKKYYSEEELREMFKQLAIINDLWPGNASSRFIDVHAHWRKKYWKQWFKSWYWKVRRM
jgi:hypothetical protein